MNDLHLVNSPLNLLFEVLALRTFRIALMMLTALSIMVFLSTPALASNAQPVSVLPYEAWLSTFQKSLTGPVAFSIALIGIVVGGISLILGGGEVSHFVRTIIYIIMVMSLLIGANSLMTNFFNGASISAPAHMMIVESQQNGRAGSADRAVGLISAAGGADAVGHAGAAGHVGAAGGAGGAGATGHAGAYLVSHEAVSRAADNYQASFVAAAAMAEALAGHVEHSSHSEVWNSSERQADSSEEADEMIRSLIFVTLPKPVPAHHFISRNGSELNAFA